MDRVDLTTKRGVTENRRKFSEQGPRVVTTSYDFFGTCDTIIVVLKMAKQNTKDINFYISQKQNGETKVIQQKKKRYTWNLKLVKHMKFTWLIYS